MGAVLWLGTGDWAGWLASEFAERAPRLLSWIGAGLLVYMLSLLALGIRPRHVRKRADRPR
jgi:putative peptidoglycan lipid II flippase